MTMKPAKRIVSVLLTVCLLVSCALLPASAEDAAPELSVTAFAGNTATETKWFPSPTEKNAYYLFLPAGADPSALQVSFSGTETIAVGDTVLHSGDTTDVFVPGGVYTLETDGGAVLLTVLQSQTLPAVYITTESGSLDYIHESKEHKEKGTFTAFENGEAVLDVTELSSVKGRGNSTWSLGRKKPYNIKFEKKTDLFGMGKAKKWSLLANDFDTSLLRNSVALTLAKLLGLPFTPEFKAVDLYMNGEYQGNYLICESVEVNSERVDIADLEDANEEANPGTDVEAGKQTGTGMFGAVEGYHVNGSRKWIGMPRDPEDISGGYLIEEELPSRYDQELCGFVTDYGQTVILKSPEYASQAEVNYIADVYQKVEDAIRASDGRNTDGQHYTELLDLPSLIGMYLLSEFTMNRDAGRSSTYFYKQAGESILFTGPAWDFDLSMANTKSVGDRLLNAADPETWWVSIGYNRNGATALGDTVFTLLYRREDFRKLVCEAWASGARQFFADNAMKTLDGLYEDVKASAVMNAFRWDIHPSRKTAEDKASAYQRDVQTVKDFIEKRLTVLDKGFAEDAAMLYYDANGGKGKLFNTAVLSVGDRIEAAKPDQSLTPIVAPKGMSFAGWNTAPDGSGDSYAPGEEIAVGAKTVVLYAQWKIGTEPEPTTEEPTTEEPSTEEPSTVAPTTEEPTTEEPTTAGPPADEHSFCVNETAKIVAVRAGVSAAELKALLPFEAVLTDAEGREANAEQKIGTGFIVKTADGAELTAIVPGDVNGDGKVNSTDARLTLRASAKLDSPEGAFAAAGDITCDGKLKAADARAVLRLAARLEHITDDLLNAVAAGTATE